MTAVVPALDSWLTDPARKADYIMACFLNTDNDQSVEHWGELFSLSYLIQQHTDSPENLRNAMQQSLNILMTRYFGQADVRVTLVSPSGGLSRSTATFDLKIDASVAFDGQRYSLGRLLSLVNGKFAKISEINV